MAAPGVRPLYALSNYYDAASFATDNDWGPYGSIASEDFYFNSATRLLAISRLRREIRNNPYLAGLVAAYPQAVGSSNLRSRTGDKSYNAAKDAIWRKFAKNCTVKGDSLRALEKIVAREMLIAGEIFLSKLIVGLLQPIASEYCGSPAMGLDAGSEVNGIAGAADGMPTGYRFGKMTPSGFIDYSDRTPLPARFITHVFDRDRVQMGRGLPWLLPCVKTARDLYEITRSKTKQIKDANLISGVIEKPGAAQFLTGLQSRGIDGEGNQVETSASPADAVSKDQFVIEFRPGTLVGLNPGEKLTSLMSQYNASDYRELIMLMLHAMSAPIGLPVELWFSGLGDVNYSGFKGLGTQWDGRRRDITHFLEDKFLNPIHDWRCAKFTDEGDLPAIPAGQEEKIDWAWKRTPVLDEEKHAQKANEVKLSSGEMSLADVWEEKGLYPEEVFEHRRQLWIKLQIAAGELKDGADFDPVKVPPIFLLRGVLPGEQPINPGARGANVVVDPLEDPATKPAPAAPPPPYDKNA